MIIQHECAFDLNKTLSSGQTFAWSKIKNNVWAGIVDNTTAVAVQFPDKKELQLEVSDTSKTEEYWRGYFGLNDYGWETLSKCDLSEYEKRALTACKGLTILHQPVVEVLISFILSQNNSISNICNTRLKICENFGLAGDLYGAKLGSYPGFKEFCNLTEQDFMKCKAGYRSKYLANLTYEPMVALLKECETAEPSKRHELLCSIHGVGNKVASCIELFGYHDLTAVPVDTWIKRIQREHPETAEYSRYNGYAGIMQQYLYMYRRNGGA